MPMFNNMKPYIGKLEILDEGLNWVLLVPTPDPEEPLRADHAHWSVVYYSKLWGNVVSYAFHPKRRRYLDSWSRRHKMLHMHITPTQLMWLLDDPDEFSRAYAARALWLARP